MYKLKGKKVVFLVCFYLFLPIIIFIIGWMKWYWCLLFLSAIGVSLILCIKQMAIVESLDLVNRDYKKLLFGFIIICIWVFLSGIGGMSYQTSDHEARTAIFRALVEYDWPVISADGNRGLIYYIGFWLPSALVGKMFGFKIGYWFQDIWAVIGIFIVFYLICLLRKKVEIWPLVFMIFFSGLDYIGSWLLQRNGVNLFIPEHLEWWLRDYQYSSVTTQLYWVFNQCIYAWVAIAFLIVQKNKLNILFITSSIMLTSTIPFVGMVPFSIYFLFKGVKAIKINWKEIFSFQNIFGAGFICVVSAIYLLGNVSAAKIGSDNINNTAYFDLSAAIIKYLLFCILEFGVYYFFIYKYQKNNPLFYLTLLILLICPFLKVGEGHDFCMRASIPALFVLMLLCMEVLPQIYQCGKIKFYLFMLVFCIGGITPFNEIHKSIQETVVRSELEQAVQMKEYDIESQVLIYGNFSGKVESNIFYEYFAK